MNELSAFCLGIAAASLYWSWRMQRLLRRWRQEDQARERQQEWDSRVEGYFR